MCFCRQLSFCLTFISYLKLQNGTKVRFVMFGCYCVWPHDGTHKSNEHHNIIQGTAVNGEELRLLLRAVVVRVYPP